MASGKRIAKMVTDPEDIKYLLSLNSYKACKQSVMMECFGEFDGKRRFNAYDLVTIPPGSFGPEGMKNKNSFVTTVGLWIFNKAFIEDDLVKVTGYINEPMTKKKLFGINQALSYAVLEDDISLDAMKSFLLKTQKFQPYCNILSPSITVNMMTVSDRMRKKKEELLEKYKKQLDDKDPLTSQNIEGELLDFCEKDLKDDPSMDMINSGASQSWGNNFKNMFVMRGAVKEADPVEGGYKILTSSFMDGMSKKEYKDFCNSLTGGPYARAKKTEVGGAWEKLFVKGLEHLRVLEPGSDCGTTRYKTITLTKDNIKRWIYSYIVENGKLVELTSKNMDKYIGKTVKIRYSMLCESKNGICSVCAGNLFHRLGIIEVGIASYMIPCSLKLKSMKAFHDSTVKMADMNKFGYHKIFGM